MARIQVDLDAELASEVMRRYNIPTEEEAVDLALRRLVGMPMTRREVLAMEGTGWEGDAG